MIPSSTDLTYFLEVANLLNLSRAAETIGISQPSLTLAMQRLETAVGTAILIRHKRGVSLTKAGKQLLLHARKLLQQWDTIKSETLASVHEVQGSFKIGCHPSVALYFLPRVLGDLLESYPDLEIHLKHDSSRKVTEQIINLSVDIGIVVNPVKHPDLVIKKLDDDRITLWKGQGQRAIQDIHSSQALLICDPDLMQTQAILRKLKKAGTLPSRLLTTNSLEVIAELTANNCGIGILPEKIARSKHLNPLPKAPNYDDEICVLYHGSNRDIKAIQMIVESIRKILTKKPKAHQ
ncbi:HTH-type transcriptional regulator CynR [Aquicella siphonis]|uniref:HTH-type transcriptional regulator CynR n=1 Tax=Aquicella siphonis TaxID=254247 RepID=A0A5E4PDZ0_9COXI|nr:LysR family transcriptional regulator [Aquicella siphonis]VVC75024.1 HTH-type transcriptional regulator CynR [Aquicella siphonis]